MEVAFPSGSDLRRFFFSKKQRKEKKKENYTTDIENIVVTSSVKKEVTQSSLLQNFVTSQPFVLARKLKDEKGTR